MNTKCKYFFNIVFQMQDTKYLNEIKYFFINYFCSLFMNDFNITSSSKRASDVLRLCGRIIIPPYETSQSTGAEFGRQVLYRKNTFFIVGYVLRIFRLVPSSLKYWRVSKYVQVLSPVYREIYWGTRCTLDSFLVIYFLL